VIISLTDITIQHLKPTDGQVIYWDTNLPAFGLRVSPRSKAFVVKVGNRVRTLGRYPDLALKGARLKAKHEMLLSSTPSAKTSQSAILDFLDDSRGRITPATHGQYTHYLNSFEFTGSLDAITKPVIKEKLKRLDGKPTAQNMAYATLRAFLNWCVRHEYIDRHPLLALTPPNTLQSRDRVLTDDELRAIWNATGPTGSPGTLIFNRIVRVLMLTGQRRMEIAGLKEVSDVMTFHITKNKHPHTIPITPLVMEHLQVPIVFNDWSGCKSRLDTRSKVTNWVIHDLRRTFSTNCAKLGIPIHVTEQILNHRSGSVSGIVRVYNRYNYQREMLEALLTHETFIRTIVGAQSTT